MVRTRSDGQLETLLEACAELLAGTPAATPFAAALATIEPPVSQLGARRSTLPVLRWWDESLEQAVAPPVRAVCTALDALRPALAFTQNPNYVAEPPSPTFLARYGYAVLAGPAAGPPALVAHPGLAFGVLLLGPDTTYPLHVHPAAELYLPLGPACWRVSDRPLVERPAGTPIVHRPDQPHETRTAAMPLAALYVWLGELGTAAQIL